MWNNVMTRNLWLLTLSVLLNPIVGSFVHAQTLEQRLLAESADALVAAAREQGDAQRGAIVFHQSYLACAKCHRVGDVQGEVLGPDLTKLGKEATDTYIIESLLQPSKVIKKGFQPLSITTNTGKTSIVLLIAEQGDRLIVRDVAADGRRRVIDKSDIDERTVSTTSIMPAGQMNALASRQQFLDLVRYLMDIRDGGANRARELQPPPALLAARPLPEYEKEIDHAGMIRDLDDEAYARGEAIYNRLCVNCHGTRQAPGSLPTSLRFAEGKFKSGNDPYTMYQTLTRGFGMMVPQTWMVPQQKYDVIHYIREAYLKSHNPSQYRAIKPEYLAGLPAGTTRGPAPVDARPWQQMDYGPNLVATYEIGEDGTNFAYKGNAIRLDAGPGGVAQGQYWMIFDYDTLRVAAAWSGDRFIDYNGINFNGRHGIHPRIAGRVHFANPTGPGWANPDDSQFVDPRLIGRDGRRYGPLPRKWAHYKGMYYHGNQTLIAYTVDDASVLEMPTVELAAAGTVFTRRFEIGERRRDLWLQVAHRRGEPALRQLNESSVAFGAEEAAVTTSSTAPLSFDGRTYVELPANEKFDMTNRDFTVFARFKTGRDGSLFCRTSPGRQWVPGGKSLFIRGGRLTFDIGWVGAVTSRRRVTDNKWHDVAMTYRHESGQVQFYIDGRLDRRGQGALKSRPTQKNKDVMRIGFTAANFPRQQTFFRGQMSDLRFYQRALEPAEISGLAEADTRRGLVARWQLSDAKGDRVADRSGQGHDGVVTVGKDAPQSSPQGWTVAGIVGSLRDVEWRKRDGHLQLKIPAGGPLRFALWHGETKTAAAAGELAGELVIPEPEQQLSRLTKGGPRRWQQELTAAAKVGKRDGPSP